MTRPRFARSNCCVPFCRRTSTLFRGEWLCGDHWRLVDRSLKTFRTRRLKVAYRAVEKADDLSVITEREFNEGRVSRSTLDDHLAFAERTYARWGRLERATWARMKRQAIQRAGGL